MTRLGPKEKGKARPYQSKKVDGKPGEFTGMRALIWKAANKLNLSSLYVRLWNPVNYALIGGLGMGINYLINAIFLNYMPWYFSNCLAILTAWSWNWANSVGPAGHYWGFPTKEERHAQTG